MKFYRPTDLWFWDTSFKIKKKDNSPITLRQKDQRQKDLHQKDLRQKGIRRN